MQARGRVGVNVTGIMGTTFVKKCNVTGDEGTTFVKMGHVVGDAGISFLKKVMSQATQGQLL